MIGMRVTGILLMAGTLIAGGFALAELGKERLQGLERLRQMVYHLMNRILYANVALPDALEAVGRRFRGRESEFFLKTAERLKAETDMTFASIWMEEAERFFQEGPMARNDRDLLLTLGKQLGYADRAMQERIIRFYLEQTEEEIKAIRAELDAKTRLFRCLGMTAGLFLMVLLA